MFPLGYERKTISLFIAKSLSPISSSCGHSNFVISSLPAAAAFPITSKACCPWVAATLAVVIGFITRRYHITSITWAAAFFTTPASAATESVVIPSATISSAVLPSATSQQQPQPLHLQACCQPARSPPQLSRSLPAFPLDDRRVE
uniref:Uncharacterized protein n=1 Tax=Molossus molossus TaxID=27622 RepID=A0A7J8ER25_MOLMO|nr:hypothetical protein HJG59_008658 [Molossus molossus]